MNKISRKFWQMTQKTNKNEILYRNVRVHACKIGKLKLLAIDRQWNCRISRLIKNYLIKEIGQSFEIL